MADEKVAVGGYDDAESSFDFISADAETALVCESDAAIKDKIVNSLKEMEYHVSEVPSARDALKNMRFNSYDLIVINEKFDAADSSSNEVLIYLQNLAASTRRNMFVILLSDKYRTMDNMMAFNKSVNLVVNTKNIDDLESIVKRGIEENKAFYSIFKESLKKLGRV